MTPNEKAAQLVVDYQLKIKSLDYKEAVACAIVTVDEIIEAIDWYEYDISKDQLEYWSEVKQVIEKLNKQTDADWEIKEAKQPYGAYRYQMAGDVAISSGTLTDEQEANDFRVQMKLEYKDHINFATITRVVDGKEVIENVVEPIQDGKQTDRS